MLLMFPDGDSPARPIGSATTDRFVPTWRLRIEPRRNRDETFVRRRRELLLEKHCNQPRDSGANHGLIHRVCDRHKAHIVCRGAGERDRVADDAHPHEVGCQLRPSKAGRVDRIEAVLRPNRPIDELGKRCRSVIAIISRSSRELLSQK